MEKMERVMWETIEAQLETVTYRLATQLFEREIQGVQEPRDKESLEIEFLWEYCWKQFREYEQQRLHPSVTWKKETYTELLCLLDKLDDDLSQCELGTFKTGLSEVNAV